MTRDNDVNRFIERAGWGMAGGLHVPITAAEEGAFSPFIVVHVGSDELTGSRISFEEVLADVEKLPLGFWMRVVSSISLAIEREGVLRVHESLINIFVPPQY